MIVLATLMIFAWVITIHASYTLGAARGRIQARKEYREGFKLLKGGK